MITRTVQVGGQTKMELLEQLTRNGVEINEAGNVLIMSDRFITTPYG